MSPDDASPALEAAARALCAWRINTDVVVDDHPDAPFWRNFVEPARAILDAAAQARWAAIETIYQAPEHEAEIARTAALMAAAEDLLAAAKRAVPFMADYIASGGWGSDDLSDRIALDALEAAIAKTEGRQ